MQRSEPGAHGLAEQRQALIVAVFAMALGPAIVYLLKQTTGHHCPWDLKMYAALPT